MKDSEFIELLNSYLDHEISAPDAARLEAEIRVNLERRRVYLQYCRMQQACRVIATDFAAAEAGGASDAGKRIVAFNPGIAAHAGRRRRTQLSYALGALAAAACVALVFVLRPAPSEPVNPSQPAVEIAASIPVAPSEILRPETAPSVPRGLVSVARQVQPSTLVANSLLLTGSTQAEALRAAAVRQADNQLAWIEALRLAPLPERLVQQHELHFDARLVTEGRALGYRSTPQAKQPEPGEEMVTFQIKK